MPTPVTTGIPTDGSGDLVGQGTQLDFANLLPQIIGKFIAVIEGAVIIVVAIFLIRYIHNRMRKIELEHEQQRNAVNLMEKLTSGFILVISITLALKVIGLDMTLLVSVAILGLSYGLQDIIKNYVAGILILFKAPFKIGDIVKIREFTGKISKIDFQSTTLETFDNRHVTIYNSDVMTQSIINFTKKSISRLNLDVTIGYGSDTHTALKIFERILKSHSKVLKSPKSSIAFKNFSDSGPTFTLKFWVQKPCNIIKVRTEIATEISQAFDEENIFAPYTKDIQFEEEAGLGKVTEKHKQRIQTFYQMPIFKEETIPEAQAADTTIIPPTDQAQIGPDGQPIPTTANQPILDANGQPVIQIPVEIPVEIDEDEPE